MSRIQATIRIEFRRIEQVVHDSLKRSWCISQTKGKHPELIVTKRSPECSFSFVLIPKQDLVEPRCCIKAGKLLCTKQFVKEIINTRQRISVLNCHFVESPVIHYHPGIPSLLLHKQDGCSKRTG